MCVCVTESLNFCIHSTPPQEGRGKGSLNFSIHSTPLRQVYVCVCVCVCVWQGGGVLISASTVPHCGRMGGDWGCGGDGGGDGCCRKTPQPVDTQVSEPYLPLELIQLQEPEPALKVVVEVGVQHGFVGGDGDGLPVLHPRVPQRGVHKGLCFTSCTHNNTSCSSSVQFKMVSMRLGRPTCAPPRLLGVSPMLPLKQF